MSAPLIQCWITTQDTAAARFGRSAGRVFAALVKHAGLAPRENLSGAFVGRTKLTGQGRPGLRLAAWRAVWGAQRANPVYGARYQHLTSREHNQLRPSQAQSVIAAAILRHLHAVITTRQTWDPAIATHGRRRRLQPAAAA
jgi:transposase